jgi:gamma-glutamylcyclotransferase (GGCT)/AIG2-like uncharacterized protein YtfP
MSGLFFYGVLMQPEIFAALTGRRVRPAPAVLAGYRRIGVELEGWLPVASVVPEAGAEVAGVVIRGIDAPSLALLDAFENVGHGLYRRAPVAVRTPGGAYLSVETYLPGPALDEATRTRWDYGEFMRRSFRDYRDRIVPRFLRRYRRLRGTKQGLW